MKKSDFMTTDKRLFPLQCMISAQFSVSSRVPMAAIFEMKRSRISKESLLLNSPAVTRGLDPHLLILQHSEMTL